MTEQDEFLCQRATQPARNAGDEDGFHKSLAAFDRKPDSLSRQNMCGALPRHRYDQSRGLNLDSWASCSHSFLCASEILSGTTILVVTSRSPALPRPRPRTRSFWPLAVPAGILMFTLPSRVGTAISAPSAASHGASSSS